ncbi:MAG: cyclic lactone autoinducer peptide [Clostridiales bacterium]|nr:cyclic lactone autoinducer peptide [Clostridiales bacterium]
MKKLAEKIAAAAMFAAKSAAGSASEWDVYQPKEPANLKKILKK